MLPCAHFLSNGTSVPYVTHGVDMPGFYHTRICPKMKLAYYMVRYRIDMPGVISYEYMLIYWTVVNIFRIVLINTHKHMTTITHDSTHALKAPLRMMQAIVFRHFIKVNCISYKAPDLISRVRDLFIYPAVIFSNTICVIV